MSQQYTHCKSDISYFSGKLEAYMRYSEIAHRLVDCNQKTLEMIASKNGYKENARYQTGQRSMALRHHANDSVA